MDIAPPPAAIPAAPATPIPAPAPWHRRPIVAVLAAIACGAIAACGFQPLHMVVIALLGLAGLLMLVAAAPGPGRAALLGWGWGLGHFTVALNWIATAFTYQAKMPAVLGWVAVVGLSAYLAIYPALAMAAGRWLGRGRWGQGLACAGTWIVAEWLRGWVFTGFPWDPLGVLLLGNAAHPGLALLAPWLGTYALSGLAVAIAAVFAAIPGQSPRHRLATIAGLAALFVAPHLYTPPATPPGPLPVTLVQPGFPQAEVDDPALIGPHDARIIALSTPRAPGPQAPGPRRLVLWPESGLADYLRDGYPDWVYLGTTWHSDPAATRARIAQALGPGALLLTGAVDPVMASPLRIGAVRNVVTALDDRGAIIASYAKAHLVPYGEYLPMRDWLGPLGLARLVPGDIDFQPGPGPQTLNLGPWGRAGIQICYEIVFPGHVVDEAHRPDYLVNPTNDGWFGAWGPPQHLAQARLRAIEEGLPVLRPTTSGISAIIDPHGVVIQSIPRGPAARIDAPIPQALPRTPFARCGNALSLAWALLCVASALALRRWRGYQRRVT